jgi:hypothetical protein
MPTLHTVKLLLAPRLASWFLVGAAMPGSALELERAVIVGPDLIGPDRKAVQILVEEVEKRSGIRWRVSTTWPETNAMVIAVGTWTTLESLTKNTVRLPSRSTSSEAYRVINTVGEGDHALFILGSDQRGVLFGAGPIRSESFGLRKDRVRLQDNLDIAGAPKYPLRGHQLGYRPKCNSYDAWDLPVWDQYMRDLVVFGCNAIELIPPRSDDAATSPHFPRPPMEMMTGMSRLADSYLMDVWIWYPAMDEDYSDPATVEFALKEWGEVFRALPRIDAVFVPGGDPGHTQPKYLMALLEKQTQSLRRFHPKAQMWVSPQSFDTAWMEEFLAISRSNVRRG